MAEQHVFISYSRLDSEFVDQLTETLRHEGIAVWRDTENIQPGTNWQREIEDALSKAAALLYVASKNAAESSWMQNELSVISQREIKIIPLILDDIGAQRLPLFLRQIQWVDFRTGFHRNIYRLLDALQAFKQKRPESTPTKKSKGYVFLSYAEEDTEFVEQLKGFLAGRGYAYWDYQESDRDYHQDLFLELEGIIREAEGTLSILSPDWKQSSIAVKEYYFSLEVGIPVFLLKAREVGPTLVIAGMPYIDFTRDQKAAFQKLGRELERKGL
ncbi:MAG: toll/interleukin-1 receptor domain-containing protein [Acidobacteriota bacterium]|nr:toll/interleukin-1 receptor domain-containing protein [Acidobacteriota bacterium]